MKKMFSLLAGLLVLASCTNHTAAGVVNVKANRVNNPKKDFNSSEVYKLNDKYVNSLQSFAKDYLNVIDKKENQVFSPLSIATCYSMLYDGAKEETKAELAGMLHYDDSFEHLKEIQSMLLNCAIDDEKEKVYLDIAQSVWTAGKNIVQDKYLKTLEDYYYAEVYDDVDFGKDQAKQAAADWVNQKTKNFLDVKKEAFNSFNGNTLLVLFNTIYTRSPWGDKELFEEKHNKDEMFTKHDGNESKVTFMNDSVYGSYYENSDYYIASLPFKKDIRINFLLPNSFADTDKVFNDQEAITALVNYPRSMETESCKINWKVPKFKIKSDYDLMSVLQNLGLKDTFGPMPDLGDMMDPSVDDYYISASRHVAGIELDNEGVKAAAYTYIQADSKAAPAPEKVINMYLNRPFAYYLTNRDGLPLFMGVVNSL